MMKTRKYSTKRRRQLTNLHLLPTLPFDIIPEILCRLPVKLLLQLRCICKSWNSLISDLKFANKHLHMSKTLQHNHHLILNTSSTFCNLILEDCQIPSVFSARPISVVRKTKFSFPDILKNVSASHLRVCSCNDILCLSTEIGTLAGHSVVLWNPSIRKFNVFPPLPNQGNESFCCSVSFGYNHFTHTYKIVAVSYNLFKKKKNQVSVYTLGSNSWRRIQDLISNLEVFPSHTTPGVFASGTINWLTSDALGRHIVSLDLEKESYRKISKPNLETNHWSLGVSRDCLCIFASTERYVDVWIMKEYGNEESWTKLYRVRHLRDLDIGFRYDEVLYISEDDQLLMYCTNLLLLKFVVYDSKKHTFITPKLPTIGRFLLPQVYIESLISPCS